MNLFLAQVRLIVRNDVLLMRREIKVLDFLNGAFVALLIALGHGVIFLICLAAKTPAPVAVEAIVWYFFAFIMLSMAMNTAIGMIFERSDFDLLLSSPVAPRAILLARLTSVATTAFLGVVIFIPPIVDIEAAYFSAGYLAGYLVWLLLAIGAAAFGISSALVLVRVFGARRARTIGQVVAAILGGSVYLVAQLPQILAHTSMAARLMEFFRWISVSPIFLTPALAGRGDPRSLALLTLLVAAFVGLTLQLLSRTFVTGLQDSGGISSKGPRAVKHKWTEGLAAATFWKDVRLIVRDPMVLAKTLPQVAYMIPLVAIIFKYTGLGAIAPVVYFLSLILSGVLTMIAVSGEECWDLIRMSPSSELKLRNAKIAAGMALPMVLVLLSAVFLIATGRFLLAPLTIVVSVVCSAAMCRLTVTTVMPRKRSDILQTKRFGGGGQAGFTGNQIWQVIASLFFMGTGGGGLGVAASGKVPLLSAVLIVCALLGAAAVLALVKFNQIRWLDSIETS